MTHNDCKDSIIPAKLNQNIENFLKFHWYENYRYGREIFFKADRAKDQQMLNQRIIWLELPESERLKEMQKTLGTCQTLYRDTIKELEFQARQVPSLIDTVKSLRLQVESLRLQLSLLNMGGHKDNGFSINFGDGIPPLVFEMKPDKLEKFYRKLAMTFHPDKNLDDSAWCEQVMKSITAWHSMVTPKPKVKLD